MKKILCIIWIALIFTGCDSRLNSADIKFKKAEFYSSEGNRYIEKAINLYKEVIKESHTPELKESANLKLGSLYLEIGCFEQARDCFLGVTSEDAKKKLAIAYFRNSQYSDALAQFERVGKLNDSEYLYYYGQALEKSNLYDKALEIYSLIPAGDNNYSQAKTRIDAIGLSEKSLSGDILKDLPRQEDYPEAGAIILLAEEEFEVSPDNTAQFDIHFMIKIFNDRGKEEFSEVEIGYDSTFEEVKLDFARTIKPDGSVIYVGDKNIRDVSIYLNYPLYSNARARIISMPEVSEGAIIEYKAKIIRKQLVNKKDFVLNYSLKESEPIKNAKFIVKIPKERTLNYKIINAEYNNFGGELNPKVEIIGEQKIFTWQIENIPEILPEPDMPPTSRINPIIMISTFNSWQEVFNWWYDLYKDKIQIDKDIQQKINELIKDKNADEDKVRAIYNFCAQDIRYVAVEYGQAGYEPHYAKDIFKNKYGDCKDQSILLISMLRSIGIKAYPVLIGTFDYLNLEQDFPSISFNHCIAATNFQDEWIFMDPTGQTVPFRDLPSMDKNRLVFVVLDDGYKIISTPTSQPQENLSKILMKIKINKDGAINAKRKIETDGLFEHSQRYWLKFTKPKFIKEVLEATANGLAPGARLLDYNIENVDNLDREIILEYEFQAPEFLSIAGNSRLLPQLGGIDISSTTKEERSYPIEYPVLIETETVIEIEIPSNLMIKYIPDNFKVDSDYIDFENNYTKKNNLVLFFERYRLKRNIVEKEEYKKYKELIEDIAHKINQRIILEIK